MPVRNLANLVLKKGPLMPLENPRVPEAKIFTTGFKK
jgi:hypothetical protein